METVTKKQFGENDINLDLTQKLRKDPKYQQFLDWCKDNGLKERSVGFPFAFGPNGVVGAAATENIPPNTTFLLVPNKLLITPQKAENSELAKMVEAHPTVFKEGEGFDYNCLTSFLLFERIKGKDSFYYPYFECISAHSTTLMSWSIEELEDLDSFTILNELKELIKDRDETWSKLKKIFDKYPELYPPAKYGKDDYFWAYESVMTRCFGWDMPCTMLVPFADAFNHGAEGSYISMVNFKFEREQNDQKGTYALQKRDIDLSLIGDSSLVISAEDRENYSNPIHPRLIYIRKRLKYLSKKSVEKFHQVWLSNFDEKQLVREINLSMIKNDDQTQIWGLAFVDSDAEEDNDSDFDEEEEDQAEYGTEIRDKVEYIEINNQADKEMEIKEGEKADWTWFDHYDPENYFAVTTNHRGYLKGDQIIKCYGQRKNEFLLLWYGFAVLDNKYESFVFRLWTNTNTSKGVNPKALLFKNNPDESQTSKIKELGEMGKDYEKFTKEFKIKCNYLCEDLLSFLRGEYLVCYKGSDFTRILVTIPKSLNYEEQILELAKSLMIELLNQYWCYRLLLTIYATLRYKTSSFDDEEVLKDASLPYKKRFAIIFHLGHKKIIREQLKLLNILQLIIKKLKAGTSFKEAYLSLEPSFEKDEFEMIENRKKMRDYLKLLYLNYKD